MENVTTVKNMSWHQMGYKGGRELVTTFLSSQADTKLAHALNGASLNPVNGPMFTFLGSLCAEENKKAATFILKVNNYLNKYEEKFEKGEMKFVFSHKRTNKTVKSTNFWSEDKNTEYNTFNFNLLDKDGNVKDTFSYSTGQLDKKIFEGLSKEILPETILNIHNIGGKEGLVNKDFNEDFPRDINQIKDKVDWNEKK